mmetsp:Transcript_8149/g.12096  ORF Transcript_8149/g.12096 Transcript_8149/m.12096 type:complete len:511 (-) Transcript_8149:3395-4927(-)
MIKQTKGMMKVTSLYYPLNHYIRKKEKNEDIPRGVHIQHTPYEHEIEIKFSVHPECKTFQHIGPEIAPEAKPLKKSNAKKSSKKGSKLRMAKSHTIKKRNKLEKPKLTNCVGLRVSLYKIHSNDKANYLISPKQFSKQGVSEVNFEEPEDCLLREQIFHFDDTICESCYINKLYFNRRCSIKFDYSSFVSELDNADAILMKYALCINTESNQWSHDYYYVDDMESRLNKDFSFLTFGDMGTTNLAKNILHGAYEHKLDNWYDFLLCLGDIPYATSRKLNYWNEWADMASSYTSQTPIYPVVGNHDSHHRCYLYEHWFGHTLSKSSDASHCGWYTFSYGHAIFIVLSNEHPLEAGSEQGDWLVKQAKKIKKLNPKWVIVACHKPAYSQSRTHKSVKSVRCMLEHIHSKYIHLDLVICGHSHCYERTYPLMNGKATSTEKKQYIKPKNPIYLIVGTGGKIVVDHFTKTPAPYSLKRIVANGYLQVDVTQTTLTCSLQKYPTNSLLDRFQIQK